MAKMEKMCSILSIRVIHIGLVGLENFTSRPGGRPALKPKAKRKQLDEKGGVNRGDNGVKNGGGNRDKKGGRREK
jgi:hypothetical protein